MNKNTILISILLTAFLTVGIFSYISIKEDRIATHWNASGQANGYMDKFWGIFLFPIISIGLLLLFIVIPKIDPLKSNIKKFKKYYDSFIIVMMLFMLFIYTATMMYNFGYQFNMSKIIIPSIGLLFIYLGSIMKQLKKNWFIGVRTPWTLSSNKVWEKTHKLGSKLFIISGIVILLGFFFPPKYLLAIILIPTLTISFGLILYSYLLFKKETKS